MAAPELDTPTITVTIVVTASNDHISYARLLSTAVAGRIGFDYDAIEDVRIAISELCSTLIASAIRGSELTLICRGDESGLHVTGRAPQADGAPPLEPDELSEQVLAAVVDKHEYRVDDAEVTFMMLKSTRQLSA